MLYSVEKSILQEVNLPILSEHHIQLYIKRDDLIDDEVSGNKWRKLKYNIDHLIVNKREGVLTFGGAFSNHLVATAAACHKAGVKSIGIVRGEELNETSNSTLQRCAEYGMQLVFVPRNEYDLRNERIYKEDLALEYPNYHIVPEGGANFYGMIGCQELMNEIKVDYQHVFVAQGTTATSSGILLGLKSNAKLHVVPVLKGFDVNAEMKKLYSNAVFEVEMIDELFENLIIHSDYHFGGYAKYTNELLLFIKDFYQKTKIPLDPIYTGKVMFALFDEIQNGNLDNSTVVFIHTGGIQGAKAIQEKEKISFYA